METKKDRLHNLQRKYLFPEKIVFAIIGGLCQRKRMILDNGCTTFEKYTGLLHDPPPFLNKDEMNWKIFKDFRGIQRTMMNYKETGRTMIHSIKDKCFKMHFRKIQELKKEWNTRPLPIQKKKLNHFYTHKPPIFTQTKIFREFFGKMFENVRNRTPEETNLDYFEKWPHKTPLQATKSTCLDTLYLFK